MCVQTLSKCTYFFSTSLTDILGYRTVDRIGSIIYRIMKVASTWQLFFSVFSSGNKMISVTLSPFPFSYSLLAEIDLILTKQQNSDLNSVRAVIDTLLTQYQEIKLNLIHHNFDASFGCSCHSRTNWIIFPHLVFLHINNVSPQKKMNVSCSLLFLIWWSLTE